MNIDTTPRRITHVPAVNRVAKQKPAAPRVPITAAVKTHVQPQEAANRVALTKGAGHRVNIAA